LKWYVLYWEEKKQVVEGGKEGIKINSTLHHHRGKMLLEKLNEIWVRR
jgi:hypothetical protein